MIESKAWDWEKVEENEKEKIWLQPCIESYFLINRWKQQNKKSFLDIGCGLGRHTIQFAKAGFETQAIDLSTKAIESASQWARKENLTVQFLQCDMLNLPFKNEMFDCILCRNVISHTDTEGIKKIIQKLYDILKINGECFLTLGSKSANTFKNPNNILVDENTKLRMDEGPEKGVPHFYADMNIIPSLFHQFEIIYIAQVEDFKQENNEFKSRWHYVMLIRRKENEK